MAARTSIAMFALTLVVGGAASAQQGGSRASGPDDLVQEMTGWVNEVEAAQDAARTDDEDATLYDCLTQKAVNMSAYLILATEAQGRLASAGDDAAARADAVDLIQTAHGRVAALKSEADQCESDVINYAGAQSRDSSTDRRIPASDTTGTGTSTSPTGAGSDSDDSDTRNTPVL